MRLPTPPRWARYVGIGLLAIVASLIFGVTTASTQASLGPHNALYEVTTDSTVIVDLGPLGTIQLASPLPLSLGVTVTIEEIPSDLTAVDSATTLAALSSDLDSYLQFFSGSSSTVSYVAKALVEDAVFRAVIMLVSLIALGIGGYFLLGPSRRRQLGEPLARSTWAITAGILVVAVTSSVVVTQRADPQPDEVNAQTSSVFDGTALDGARITGRLSGVIATYGGQLVKAYRSNEAFYADANSALTEAWQVRSDQIAEQDQPLPTFDGPEPEGAGEPTPAMTTADESIVTLLMVSDLHCNTGMSPLIRNAAELSGASIILNGGDSTITGTAIERFCIDSFVGAAPAGVDWVQVDGNHDSAITANQARAAGATVLDGAIVTIQGIRFLGDSDPAETRIGQGSVSATGETLTEAGDRLRDVACEASDGVDILLIHTPRVGDAALDSGCVPIQLSGHTHQRAGPLQVGAGVRYVSSTTAGAAEGQATIGPLNGVAELTVFRYSTGRRVMLDYQIITVSPDGSVQVGDRLAFPSALTPVS